MPKVTGEEGSSQTLNKTTGKRRVHIDTYFCSQAINLGSIKINCIHSIPPEAKKTSLLNENEIIRRL